MAITEQDIKLLKAARMTDTPDGGGAMTGNVVLSGEDNNVFDDVSNLDRVYGAVSLRKVFPAVLTNDTEKYLGARVIIDKPHADEYVEGTLFAASSIFDVRSQAQGRVEAYLAPGTPYQGLLYGPHIIGMRVVSFVQQADRPIPSIGQVFILRKGIDTASETEQFVRVTNVTHSTLTFTDSVGDFTRRVVVCDISDALRYDFAGWEAIRVDADLNYTGKTRIFNSVVADAAQYYGIRKLEEPAAIGDFSLKADGSYAQLLPSAQIETPIADASASGYALASQAVGSDITYVLNCALSTTQKLFIGGTIARGTLSMVVPGQTSPYVDDGTGVLTTGGVPIGAVDYVNGVVALSDNNFSFTNNITITYKVAATPSLVLRSTAILITLENRSLSHVRTLATAPSPGTLTVSYMVAGQWYVLRDSGAGAVVADDAGFGAGNINYSSRTLAVTLGALPDVGGTIVIQWGEKQAVQDVGLQELANDRAGFIYYAPEGGAVLASSDVSLTWAFGGNNFSASLAGGVSTGDADILPMVGYGGAWIGGFRIYPHRIPPASTAIGIQYRAATQTTVPNVPVLSFSIGSAVSPRTFRLLDVAATFTYAVTGKVGGKDLRLSVPLSGNSFAPVLSQAGVAGSASWTANGNFILFDDGAGKVFLALYSGSLGRAYVEVGTINYATGAVVINASVTAPAVVGGPDVYLYDPASDSYVLTAWQAVPSANKSLAITIAAQNRDAAYTPVGGSVVTRSTTPTQYAVEPDLVAQGGLVFRSVSLAMGGKKYAQDLVLPGVLVADVNPLTGAGVPVGTVDVNTGRVVLTSWAANGPDSTVTAFGAARVPTSALAEENNKFLSSELTFRTPTAPLRPGGFSVLGTMRDGTTFNLQADANGKIDNAQVAGVVNYQTGVCRLWAKETRTPWQGADNTYAFAGYYSQVLQYANIYLGFEGFRTGTVRYNAVAYTYLPLDAGILGLDPVRLPSDGRVPIFKAGRVVVVHNTQSLAPQTVTTNQTVNCGRTLLSRIRVFGNDGLEITSGFSRNLDAGTITFTNVAGMSQPVTIEHRIEDEALCADAQITGDLRLTRPLTHAYPANTSYVSSAYIKGTLQAAAQDSFSQEAWTSVWGDVAIGNAILAQYNDTANPIVVTNAGAITERWALIFTSNTTFNLVGEAVGQIISGDTATTLSPVNPATGVPYFTLQPAGWGSGWVAGNVLRFNTSGANFPLWVARTVRQSPSAAPGTDQMTISIRGDIDQ